MEPPDNNQIVKPESESPENLKASVYSRRKFIRNTVAAAGMLSLGLTSCQQKPADSDTSAPREKAIPASEQIPSSRILFEQRILGKTGISVSSLGAGQCTQPDLLVEAFNAGINVFETARGYMGGNLERIIGKALKKIPRDKVVVVTKIPVQDTDLKTNIQNTEESLKALGIDTIDILLGHGVHDSKTLASDTIKATFINLKKSGKIRFCGVSTHKTKTVAEWMIKNPFYDVLMTAFNYAFPPEASILLTQVKKAGIGIIGMKSLTFRYKDDKPTIPSALKYALSRDFIDTVVVPFNNAEHYDADLKIIKQKFTSEDEQTLYSNSMGILHEYYF